MSTEIKFVDTTVRDGNQNLWALNMRVGVMLASCAAEEGVVQFHRGPTLFEDNHVLLDGSLHARQSAIALESHQPLDALGQRRMRGHHPAAKPTPPASTGFAK